MDTRIVVVKKILDALNLPFDISSVEHRRDVQKAVYLAGEVGVTTGYEFSWYVRGPYSPELTRGYYGAELEELERVAHEKRLRADLVERLEILNRCLLELKPERLSMSEWLELAGSWEFLRKKRRLETENAESVIREQKPRLAPFLLAAKEFEEALNTPI